MFRSSRAASVGLAGLVALAACSAEPGSTPRPSTEQTMPTTAATPSAGPTTTPTSTATPGAGGSTPAATASRAPQPTDPLLTRELTDVRTGASFTLAELAAEDGPVLLEPMAIWCSSCRAQHHEVVRAHEIGEFTSVSLDVDLTDLPEDLAAYADREGWNWRFAMADAALYRLLQERFDAAVTHPPSTPLIVIERDGTVRPLAFGVGIRSAEQLLDEIEG